MATKDGELRIIPIGHAKASEIRNISWADKPKSEMAKAACKAVRAWAEQVQYRGETVTVLKEKLSPDDADSCGVLNVNGLDTHYFVVIPTRPEPVPALFAVDGGAR